MEPVSQSTNYVHARPIVVKLEPHITLDVDEPPSDDDESDKQQQESEQTNKETSGKDDSLPSAVQSPGPEQEGQDEPTWNFDNSLSLKSVDSHKSLSLGNDATELRRIFQLDQGVESSYPDLTCKEKLSMALRSLLAPMVVIIGYGIWPMTNPLEDKSAWYQDMVIFVPTWITMSVLFVQGLIFGVILRQFDSITVKALVKPYITGLASFMGARVLLYFAWDHGFNFNMPVPFAVLFAGVVSFLLQAATNWIEFPRQLRKDKEMKRRMLGVLLMAMDIATFFSAYYLLVVGFANVTGPWQFFLVPPLIGLRSVWGWTLVKLQAWARCDGDIVLSLLMSHVATATHTIMLTIVVGSLAEDYVSAALIVIDSSLLLFEVHQNVKALPGDDTKAQAKAIEVVCTAMMFKSKEIMIPLMYLLAYLVLYAGPNADLIGFVNFKGWHYGEAADIVEVVLNVVILSFVDALFLFFTGIYLKRKHRIDVLKIIVFMERRLGTVMAIQVAMLMGACFNINSVYAGQDMSLKFKWVARK